MFVPPGSGVAMRFTNSRIARLRRLLREKREALVRKAVEAGGQVDAEELQAVERLDRICGLSRPNTPALAVEVLIGVVVVLCIFSFLLLRVPQTGIELQAEAAKVRFVLARRTRLFGELPVKWIAVQGHQLVYVPPAGNREGVKLVSPVFQAETAGVKTSPMSLGLPELPVGAGVELSYGQDGTREIALCDFDGPVGLSVSSSVQIAGSAAAAISPLPVRALVFPRQLTAPPPDSAPCRRTEMLRLKFLRAGNGDLELSRDLAVRDLALYDRPDPAGDLVSTLVSGQFRLSATKGAPTTLFPGDLLDMGRPSGRMRTMIMGEKAIRFEFQGVVRSLSVGSSTTRRSAMPSVLEWWLSRERFWVAWSAGLSALAFLAGVYQWVLKRR
jgi:hypothetical protein